MLGWAIGFFVAAIIAAVFGFGGMASAFSGIAVLLFWVFVALAVVSLVFGLFNRGHVAGDGHAASRFGPAGVIALVAIVGIAVYAWMDNDMSAERAGRVVDREVSQLAENTSDAIGEVGERTENAVETVGNEVREDTSDGLDQASENVDPDNANR